LTKSFVVLIIGNSRSNYLGAQGTFKEVNPDADGHVEQNEGAKDDPEKKKKS